MSDRRRLIDALLAAPDDDILLDILADVHLDRGLAAQASALRLAARLRRVPWPVAPDETCRKYWVDHIPKGTFRPRWFEDACRNASLSGSNCCGPWIGYEQESQWPHACRRWHSLGRLPAYAPALRLLCGGRPLWQRHVVRCELYSCGVLSAAERDEESHRPPEWGGGPPPRNLGGRDPNGMGGWWLAGEGGSFPPGDWDGELTNHLAAAETLWRLRGGRAGRAVEAMTAAEQASVAPQRDGGKRWKHPPSGRLSLALARTYSRAVLREFLAGRPSQIGVGLRAPWEGF